MSDFFDTFTNEVWLGFSFQRRVNLVFCASIWTAFVKEDNNFVVVKIDLYDCLVFPVFIEKTVG